MDCLFGTRLCNTWGEWNPGIFSRVITKVVLLRSKSVGLQANIHRLGYPTPQGGCMQFHVHFIVQSLQVCFKRFVKSFSNCKLTCTLKLFYLTTVLFSCDFLFLSFRCRAWAWFPFLSAGLDESEILLITIHFILLIFCVNKSCWAWHSHHLQKEWEKLSLVKRKT